MNTIISGARLGRGGLHLGHYLGCLSPLSAIPLADATYFFVIGDTSPAHRILDKELDSDLIAMISDLLASQYGERIKVVLESRIQFEAPILLNTLCEIVTFNQIYSRHPNRLRIKAGDPLISIGDFIFILYEIYRFLAIDANYVFMNTDNLKFVDFARQVARKFNNMYGKSLSEPRLEHGIFPRLLGYNGQKMAKANNNCIFLAESRESLETKTHKLVMSRPVLSFLEGDYLPQPTSFVPDDFIPFTYLKAFGPQPIADELITSFRSGKLPLPNLAHEVFRTLDNFITPMRIAQQFYRNNPKLIWERVEQNSQEALEIVHKTESRVVSALRATIDW